MKLKTVGRRDTDRPRQRWSWNSEQADGPAAWAQLMMQSAICCLCETRVVSLCQVAGMTFFFSRGAWPQVRCVALGLRNFHLKHSGRQDVCIDFVLNAYETHSRAGAVEACTPQEYLYFPSICCANLIVSLISQNIVRTLIVISPFI
jgi:hypothetical protein